MKWFHIMSPYTKTEKSPGRQSMRQTAIVSHHLGDNQCAKQQWFHAMSDHRIGRQRSHLGDNKCAKQQWFRAMSCRRIGRKRRHIGDNQCAKQQWFHVMAPYRKTEKSPRRQSKRQTTMVSLLSQRVRRRRRNSSCSAKNCPFLLHLTILFLTSNPIYEKK